MTNLKSYIGYPGLGNSFTTMKIGLFAIGLDTYWPQFKGLEVRLRHYLQLVEGKLATPAVEIVNAGLVDTTDKAFAAGKLFRTEDVELIFLYVSTYALSSTVLPVVQPAKVPVVILNLSPSAAIDYDRFNALEGRVQMTAEWLAYFSACPVPEIANVFSRVGIPFHQVTGMLDGDEPCWQEISEWIEAARVAHIMRFNRLGLMGHYYSGMLDVYTDLTQQYAGFGGHIELLEVEELAGLRKDVGPAEVHERMDLFREVFEIQP